MRWVNGAMCSGCCSPGFAGTLKLNSRRIYSPLLKHAWLSYVQGQHLVHALVQCLELLALICTNYRDPMIPDAFSWSCSATGVYSKKSTYKMLPKRLRGAAAHCRCGGALQCASPRIPYTATFMVLRYESIKSYPKPYLFGGFAF
jgi:hypothetical protein